MDTSTPGTSGVAGVIPLADVLAGYRPRTATERDDLSRTRKLLTGADAWRRDTPLHLTASAVITHPPSRRVLLRWHPRQRAWLQVGGHADAGETDPLAVALREAREETGLRDLHPWPGAGIIHVVIVPVPASAGEPAHEHADMRFALTTAQPERVRPETAAAPLRWLTLDQAHAATTRENLRETLTRIRPLLPASY